MQEKESKTGVIIALSVALVVILTICIALVVVFVKKSNEEEEDDRERNRRTESTVDEEDGSDYADSDKTEITTETTTAATTQATTQVTTQEAEVNMVSQAEYIIPDSNSRYLIASDLAGLTKEELRLARNEIYARHGRKFQDQELQTYFNSKSWYNGTIEPENFSNDLLDEYEKANVEYIKTFE